MKIKTLLENKKTVVSFEVFPPKKETGTLTSMKEQLHNFAGLHPDFMSITYGAGSSTSKNSMEIASIIKNDFNIESLAHLTCLSSTKDDIVHILDALKTNGIENILALRGDFPTKDFIDQIPNPLQFEYAQDLIAFIRERYGDTFSIGGACYPEGHLESRSLTQDLLNLKTKVDTGADYLISQLFFDNEVFYNFLDQSQKVGINVPILAGIMPVINSKQIQSIITLSGSSMPKKFIRILDKYKDDPAALKETGIMYAIDQIIDLVTSGVKGIHIYSMNRPDVTAKIMANIPNILGHKEVIK